MRIMKSNGRVKSFFVVVKLVAAVFLLALAWSNVPVQADVCDSPDAQSSSTCYTLDGDGNQACQSSYDITQFERTCVLYDLSGGGTGCLNTLCPPPDEHGPAPTQP
jgi:hypothetical protein